MLYRTFDTTLGTHVGKAFFAEQCMASQKKISLKVMLKDDTCISKWH